MNSTAIDRDFLGVILQGSHVSLGHWDITMNADFHAPEAFESSGWAKQVIKRGRGHAAGMA
jgi:hypothetical protein